MISFRSSLSLNLITLCLHISFASPEVKVDKKAPVFGVSFEFGQVVKGFNQDNDQEMKGDVIPRTGIFINQDAIVNDKVELNVGVGGLFFYVYPQKEGLAFTRGFKFGPGISRAMVTYNFGTVEKHDRFLRFGYFPFKYNPDAKNLGEYLYRSGTYPGYLVTGGWWNVDYSLFYGSGLQFHWSQFNGFLTHDFTLFAETDYYPNFDLTPTYIAKINFENILNLSAGASFYHYIPVKPSLLNPENEKTNLVYLEDFPDLPSISDSNDNGNGGQIAFSGGAQVGPEFLYKNLEDVNGNNPYDEKMQTDIATRTAYITKDDPAYIATPFLYTDTTLFRYKRTIDSGAFTHKGIKLMVAGAVDFKNILRLQESLSPEDLRLYTEIAILGVKDQPYYFDNVWERMPIMFGFNFPTFKILDVLSIQLEYYRSRFTNNNWDFSENFLPIPTVSAPWQFKAKEKDWNWSIYSRKTLPSSMGISVQIANDHMRTPDPNRPFSTATVLPKSGFNHWYYMFRLDMAI